MLKLELPQVMLPRSKAPNADVRAFFLPVPAHVRPPRLSLYPPIPFPDARPGSVKFELVQALCCLVHLELASWSRAEGLESLLSVDNVLRQAPCRHQRHLPPTISKCSLSHTLSLVKD